MHADGLMEPTAVTLKHILEKARLDHGLHSTLKLLFLKQELSNFISLKVTFELINQFLKNTVGAVVVGSPMGKVFATQA